MHQLKRYFTGYFSSQKASVLSSWLLPDLFWSCHLAAPYHQLKRVFDLVKHHICSTPVVYARWAHKHCFLAVCDYTKVQTRPKFTRPEIKILLIGNWYLTFLKEYESPIIGKLPTDVYLSPPVLMHGGLICITLLLYKKLLDTNSLDINSYLENYY